MNPSLFDVSNDVSASRRRTPTKILGELELELILTISTRFLRAHKRGASKSPTFWYQRSSFYLLYTLWNLWDFSITPTITSTIHTSIYSSNT